MDQQFFQNMPIDVKHMSIEALDTLSAQIRTELIAAVSKNSGHLASNLGVVELTLAINKVFDIGRDSVVYDVGHQCYTQKLISGRSLSHLRAPGGVSGFPLISEGDDFGTGHAGTAISAALGIARAFALQGLPYKSIAVVGDGSMTNGQCYEALNDAGNRQLPLVVILNDNEMSIDRNVGALSAHLSRIARGRTYRGFKKHIKTALSRLPWKAPYRLADRFKTVLKQLLLDSSVFEALGFSYVGPVDGHNLRDLIDALTLCQTYERPVVLHVITKKGFGYPPALENPTKYHSIHPSSEQLATGEVSSAAEAGHHLCALADDNPKLCAVCAAMRHGTGLDDFARRFPQRFFDVGIAEAHAVTMAAGMAAKGMLPFVVIYSTFFQRAYDQILHDIALQNLPVKLLVVNAGFAPCDGATHHGIYDLSYLGSMPNLKIFCARDAYQLRLMMNAALNMEGPVAIHIDRVLPRFIDGNVMPLPQWELVKDGADLSIIATGSAVYTALQAAKKLEQKTEKLSIKVVDARAVKPLDIQLLYTLRNAPILTVEEGVLSGGMGQKICAALSGLDDHEPFSSLGCTDYVFPHSTRDGLLEQAHLSCGDIIASAEKLLKKRAESLSWRQ